ncbi:MAG: hypothetical protein J7K40_00240 [candidate division Zixibacteria bacterium]|nr:hypothetical protein [candidate division Zixibacteria bacterium]
MSSSEKISERERKLRVELQKRTVGMYSDGVDERIDANDSPEVVAIGKEVSRLIDEEHLEEAREQLKKELAKKPNELGLLNLQIILDCLEKPFGSYDQAKKTVGRLMKIAVENDNSYYTSVALNNIGFIANKEGLDEFSRVMYLAAHFIDKEALSTIYNLAGWYARKNMLEEAQKWVDLILEISPDWQNDEKIVTFFRKRESLENLRSYGPFKTKILAKLKGNKTAKN